MLLSAQKSLPKKIAFLDRDGVINKKAKEHQYITKSEDFIFNEGIFKVLAYLKDRGFEFIILTNQRGVARGIFSEDDLCQVHSHMNSILESKGINILDIFYCPHHGNECDCRKPKPGMLRKACERYDVTLSSSLFITDSEKEYEMGEKFGLGQTILVNSDKPEEFFSKYVAQ